MALAILLWLVPVALASGSCLLVVAKQQSCDLYRGNWVIDEAYPLYDASKNCPYLGLDCVKNGRPDRGYLKYRWKPYACHLPRFDGKKLLERYRGKQIMFVGDSISLNMWQSLTCMLHMAVPNSNYTFIKAIDHDLFTFPEYGTSIIWLKNRFLVDLVHGDEGIVLKLDSISSGGQWKEANVLIFNTFHWWTHTGHLQSWDYFQLGNKLIKEMDRLEAFKIGLTTWAKWIDSNIDFSKTRVFYQGIAASHGADKKSCVGQTQPKQGSTIMAPNVGEEVVKSVISKMTKPIELLDITLLTQLRIDGHPSVYTGHNDSSFVDCSHWCLPGAPDSWNEILYATLLRDY